MSNELRIAISAGELSGDEHAARLVRALLTELPGCQVRGMGGANLRGSGAELVVDSDRSASVMGFQESLGKIGSLLGAYKAMKRLLDEWQPNVLILIDFPEFNLRLARYASRRGIKTIYFIPPKVWVWRKNRVNVLRRYIDHIIAIFPFEERFFAEHGMRRVTFVGHPLAHEINIDRNSLAWRSERSEFCGKLGLDAKRPVVALLAGSRSDEIRRHLPIMLEAADSFHRQHPDVQFVLSLPNAEREKDAQVIMNGPDRAWLTLAPGQAIGLMRISDAGVIKSGTSNLQALCAELPFIMVFQASKVTEFIVRAATNNRTFSITNIIRPDTVRELIQEQFNPQQVSAELDKLLYSVEYRSKICANLTQAKTQLVQAKSALSPAERAARVVRAVIEVPKIELSLTKRVLAFILPYKKLFGLALVCMVLFGATDGAIPFIIKHVLDGVFSQHKQELLYILPIIVIGFALLRALLDFGQQYLTCKVGHSIVQDIRNKLQQKLLSLSSGFFINTSSADLVARTTGDVMLVRTLLTDAVAAILRDTVRVVALVCAAIYLDPTLAGIALLAFPIGIYPVYRFGRRLRKLSKRGQEEIGRLSANLQESILGQRVVKSFNQEDFEIKRYQERNRELTKIFLRSEKVRAITGPINEVLASVAIAGVILYGGLSVLNNVRTQGDFIAFLISVFLLYDPFKKLSRMNATVQQGLSGAERIFEVLDEQPQVREAQSPIALGIENSVSFENVDFAYKSDGELVLSGISLQIKSGETVALVGLSGAGKSTLVDLLPRFIDPTRGIVKIGGVDIKRVRIRELRERIATVGQHTFLFNDTVFNNIAYGKPNATMEDVRNAAKAAYADEFISQLSNGYETVIGEGGFSLSGGQRQRVAIARALLKNAPILILDEATAALDNKSEREVQLALEALQRGRTSLVIAHRLSTVRNADRIVVMKDGKIVEQGSHAELLRSEAEYARLYALQFGPQDMVQGTLN